MTFNIKPLPDKSDYNTRAAKGQALNLAVADAIHQGKKNSKVYILERYVYYYNIAAVTQELTLDETKGLAKELAKEENNNGQ